MLTLAAGDTIAGVADAATTVNVTIFGLEISAGVETYKCLYQGQLAAAAATLYTVPASTVALVRSIHVVNTSAAAARTFQLFRGGTAAANAITDVKTLPIGGSAVYDGDGWSIYPASSDPWVTTVPVGTQIIDSQAAAAIPLVIQGHASQSADLFVVENSAGSDLVAVTAAGILSIPGGGIKFPATQVASADANTLDDYEEGSWTPTLSFTTPGDLSVTYSTQEGDYVRVGDHVFLSGRVVTSAFTYTTATGALRMGGLPFTPSTPAAAAIAGLVICSGFSGTFGAIGWRPINASSALDLVAQSTVGGAVTTMTTTQWLTTATVNLRIAGHYRI